MKKLTLLVLLCSTAYPAEKLVVLNARCHGSVKPKDRDRACSKLDIEIVRSTDEKDLSQVIPFLADSTISHLMANPKASELLKARVTSAHRKRKENEETRRQARVAMFNQLKAGMTYDEVDKILHLDDDMARMMINTLPKPGLSVSAPYTHRELRCTLLFSNGTLVSFSYEP